MSGRYSSAEEVIAESLLLLVASGIAISLLAVVIMLVSRAWGRVLERWAKRHSRSDLYIVGHVEQGRTTVHLVGRDEIELLREWPSAAGREALEGELIDDLSAKGLVRRGTTRGRRRLVRALSRDPDRGFVLELGRADALLASLPVASWLEVGRRGLGTAVEHARRRCRRYLERRDHRPRDGRRHTSARGAG